jgi:hypothetical protein
VGKLSNKLRSVEGGRIMFWCPGCDGAHQVSVENKTRPNWWYNGNASFPTFRPSIHVNAPGEHHRPQAFICHSFVTDGKIQFLSDCTHPLAGQTVDVPDWDSA